MKIVILALLVAAVFGASMIHKDGKVNFEVDTSPESQVGFTMKGSLNPQNDDESSVETFFRLAEQLIPLAQSSLNEKKDGSSLQFYRQWCFFGGVGSAISVCAYANAELWVGWRVDHDGGLGLYNVTYTPFSYFQGGVNVSAASYPAEVSYGGYLQVYNLEVPINVKLGENAICWSGDFFLYPTSAFTAINTNLLQCQRSVPDMTPWACDRVQGVQFQHLHFDFFEGLYIDLLPSDCFTF